MRAYLLSLIPWTLFSWGIFLLGYSYTGQWPDAWVVLAVLLLAAAYGARDLT